MAAPHLVPTAQPTTPKPRFGCADRAYLQRELTDHFETNILLPDGDCVDPVASAIEVDRAIIAGGGFEFMLLGMGINGHIGFFEPADSLPSGPFMPAIDEINRQRYVFFSVTTRASSESVRCSTLAGGGAGVVRELGPPFRCWAMWRCPVTLVVHTLCHIARNGRIAASPSLVHPRGDEPM